MKKALLSILIAFVISLQAIAQGAYFEMKMTSTGGESVNGVMKTYAQDGNTRTEMNMSTAMGQFNTVSLNLKTAPNTLYLLNQQAKTYIEITIAGDEEYRDYAPTEYEVTVLGNEKINGYNCKHVKIRIKGSKNDMEMWLTTELQGYADFAKVKTKYTGKDNLYKALEAKGVNGFPVRIKASEKGQGVQLDLIKAEKRTHPASLFSLSGYNKGAGASINPNMDMNELMKQMMNMTPEEREKWAEQMKQMYQQPK